MLREGAGKTWFLGVQVYSWGLYVFFGAIACAGIFAFLMRRAKAQKGLTALTLLMMTVCGLLFSRLFYCLTDSVFSMVLSWPALFLLNGGGYSMMGALFGAGVGVWLAAGVTRENARRLFDRAAVALTLFVAVARLGEGTLEHFGVSRPLYTQSAFFSFLTTSVGRFGDTVLNTWMLESFYALICFFIGLKSYSARGKDGETALKVLLFFGAGQILFESLRYDNHMRQGFVGVQHILSFCCLMGVALVYARRTLKAGVCKKRAVILIVSLPLLLAALVGLEFMIDRSGISNLLLYVVYIVLICAVTGLALSVNKFVRQGEHHGTGEN